MEDIPRDVQKEIDGYKVSKGTRKGRNWTLLFVGEQGEVITIRKFRGLMLLAIFIMVVAISVAVSIYMLYKKPLDENRRLEAALAKVEKKVAALGEERDLLLTRLGITESRIKKSLEKEPVVGQAAKVVSEKAVAGSQEQPRREETKPVQAIKEIRTEPELPVKPEIPKPAIPKPEIPKPEIPKPEIPKPEIPKPGETAGAAEPEIKVDIKDFQVRHDPKLNLLNVQFQLKNINPEVGAVSGRTFVVLENDQDDGIDILTFPQVTLVDGKPAQIPRGRYFSISRFNIVKFKSGYDQEPRPYNSAIVFVYSAVGDLLLEKRFAIENPFENPETTVPEIDDNQTEEAGETEASPGGFDPNNNTILKN